MPEVNVLVRNEHDVAALQGALHHGTTNLRAIPSLLKGIIRNEEWRERALAGTGAIVTFTSFAAFVVAPLPEGLNADIKTLLRLCGEDPEAMDLIGQAIENPVGTNQHHNNVMIQSEQGNSEQYALRKLRKDRPDLHDRVLSRELSAHAAMVAAGYRHKMVTVKTDPSAFARAARKHLTDDQIDQLIEMLEAE